MGAEQRYLINEDGSTFSDEIETAAPALAELSNEERRAFRDANAAEIAKCQAGYCLVVSGPGSGKSFLFLGRIQHWLGQEKAPEIHVSSFVRKLVKDLQADIKAKIEPGQQKHVIATTLHTLARSLIERNNGTSDLRLAAHISVMGPRWEPLVWDDALAFHPELDTGKYSLRAIQEQLYDDELSDADQWPEVRATFDVLRIFFNAVGFADMIVTARIAVEENPNLITQSHWIFDEHQDFNTAEDHLVETVTADATAVLLAGDDDQALYQQLKHSHPEIIKSYYERTDFAKAMLPYCSRCSYYVCLAASAFIDKHRANDGIAKMYLPLVQDPDATKVQIVAAATPSSAVDYVVEFIETHREELEKHRAVMKAGTETDAYLMILSPDSKIAYYKTKGADATLQGVIAEWSNPAVDHSPSYRTIATYYGVAHKTSDNFEFRKVLAHEGVSIAKTHELIVRALDVGIGLTEVADGDIATATEHCTEVADVLDSEELTPEEKAKQCAQIVSVGDVGRLAEELAADPIATTTDEGDDSIEASPSGSAVQLQTIVGSKGLSAKHVIVLGCDNVNLTRITPLAFYVALSRARESLHLVVAVKAGGAKEAHSFVLDLPEDCCEYWMHKKTGKPESLAGRAAFKKKLASLDWAAAKGKRRRG